MRKLRWEISAEQAANAALQTICEKAGCKKSSGRYVVTKELLMCTHCYFPDKNDYMHEATAFGAFKLAEVLPKVLMDGAWTRCGVCRAILPSSSGPSANLKSEDLRGSQAVVFQMVWSRGMDE